MIYMPKSRFTAKQSVRYKHAEFNQVSRKRVIDAYRPTKIAQRNKGRNRFGFFNTH
jgi:hypothetical protein